MLRSRHLLPVLLLLMAGAATDAGSLSLGKRYKDESNGFQVYAPSKWEMVPTKFQDVATVGKWVAKRAKRGAYTAELHVLRFLKAVEQEEPRTPAEAVERGIPGYAGMMRDQPKDIWDWIENLAFGRKFDIVEDEAEFKMSRKAFRAHFRVFKQQARGGGGRDADRYRLMLAAAQIDTVEESDSSFGVAFLATVADEKDMLRTFKTIIKRFRILDPDEEDDEDDVTDADIFVDSTKKPEIWREARKRKLIPGWDAIDTENYLIVHSKEVKRPLLKKIAKHIEAIRKQVYEPMFPPSREIKAISVVRVCKDRQEYHRYGGPGGSAGYWSRGDEELVFYQDKSNKKDSLRVLYHEAFHQYIHYAVGDVAPHSWFNEGHGDYFAGHNYRGGKFKADVFRWRTGIISNAIGQKTYVPLRRFLKYTQGEYYANPGLCYAQGWSFIYFLREVERRKIKRYKQYFGLLDKYFAAIKANVKKVKDEGLYGLENKPPEEEPTPEGPEAGEEEKPAAPTLPRLPGLEAPFPGEHPEAGAAETEKKDGSAGRRTVAGPKITGVKSALDVAVDQAFKGIDLDQLEKDWIKFSK